MTISFNPYVFDAARRLWLLPQASRQDPDAFELNVSNVNGADLLLAMGLNPDAGQSPMPVDAFSALVTSALRRHLGHRSPALENVVDQEPGKTAIIHCGRREGYIEEALGALAALVQRSRAAKATHFGWGNRPTLSQPVRGGRRNPYILQDHRDDTRRADVIRLYEARYQHDIARRGPLATATEVLAARLRKGERLILMCWCAGPPMNKPRHGDLVIKQIRHLLEFKCE